MQAKSVQIRSKSSDIDQTRADFGRARAETARIWPEPGLNCPNLWATSNEVGAPEDRCNAYCTTLAIEVGFGRSLGWVRPNSGWIRPELDQILAGYDNVWARVD